MSTQLQPTIQRFTTIAEMTPDERVAIARRMALRDDELAALDDRFAAVSADDICVGDSVIYPSWTGPTVTGQPQTVASIVEFPDSRVFYFAAGGLGIAGRADARILRAPDDDADEPIAYVLTDAAR